MVQWQCDYYGLCSFIAKYYILLKVKWPIVFILVFILTLIQSLIGWRFFFLNCKCKTDTKEQQIVIVAKVYWQIFSPAVEHVNNNGQQTPHPPFFFPHKFNNVKLICTRQLFVVQSRRREQKSVLNRSCAEHCLRIHRRWHSEFFFAFPFVIFLSKNSH